MGEPKHLYVHLPFCRSRCSYCDFPCEPMAPHARAGRVERYLEALRAELTAAIGGDDTRATADCWASAKTGVFPAVFETIYVGGGTPTALPVEDLVLLVEELACLKRAAEFGPAAEFTVEANPGTIDRALLELLAEAGVNRLSLGVQSFGPMSRATLGRKVTQAEIAAALGAIKDTGWPDWNLDLVFAIPGQSWTDAAADLDAAMETEPTHISLYDLTYTPAFIRRVDSVLGPKARREASIFAEEHYSAAVARLEAGGYRRYEVSNFALPGHECRHNQAYWRGEDYLGIGAGAVSTIAGVRRTNPGSVRQYLAGESPQNEVLSPAIRLWEKAMLGLRTSEGIDETELLVVLDQGARDRLLVQGCLEEHCGKLRLNPGFMDIGNAVISALLVSPEEL